MTGIVSIPRGLETRCHILLKPQCISTLVALVNWWHYSTKSRRAPHPPMPRLGCRLMQRLASLCTKLDQVAPPRSDLTSYNRYLCQVARPKWILQNWQKDFLLLLILLVLVSTVSTLRSKVQMYGLTFKDVSTTT